jgi:hypothetical protein
VGTFELKMERFPEDTSRKRTIHPDARAGCIILGMAANAASFSSKAISPASLHVRASDNARKLMKEKGIHFTQKKVKGKFRYRKLKEAKKVRPACPLMTIAAMSSI